MKLRQCFSHYNRLELALVGLLEAQAEVKAAINGNLIPRISAN